MSILAPAAVEPEPSPSLVQAEESPFGVNHGHNFSIVASGGIRWDRQDFVWNAIEPENGTFVFDELDATVQEALDAGVKMLGILDYSAEWASSAPLRWTDGRDRAPPKYLSDWSEYVYKTVEHFKGRVDHWEVWNEPNTRYFWLPKADPVAYTKLLRAAYLAAKKANPNCTILIGGMIGFDYSFLEEVYRQGGRSYFDVLALHPYPGAPDPCFDQFNFSDYMKEVRSIMSEYGDSNKEIWFTELGWGIGGNFTKRDQANFLVRAYVLSFAEGIDKLFWFNFRGPSSTEGSALLDNDFTPRPAFQAHKTLASLLEGAVYEAKVDLKDAQCHVFKRGDERILFAWVPRGTLQVPMRIATKNPRAMDIFGKEIHLNRRGSRIEVTLTESPIILTELGERDLRVLTGGRPYLQVIGVILVVLVVGGIILSSLKRRSPTGGKKPPKRRIKRDRSSVPQACKESFEPAVCLKCPFYTVKQSKNYCQRLRKFLEE